jgi:hypothetical protein
MTQCTVVPRLLTRMWRLEAGLSSGIMGQRAYRPSAAALPCPDMVLTGTLTHLPGFYTPDTTDTFLFWSPRQPNPQSRDYNPFIVLPPTHTLHPPPTLSLAIPRLPTRSQGSPIPRSLVYSPSIAPPYTPSPYLGRFCPKFGIAPPLTGTKGTQGLLSLTTGDIFVPFFCCDNWHSAMWLLGTGMAGGKELRPADAPGTFAWFLMPVLTNSEEPTTFPVSTWLPGNP